MAFDGLSAGKHASGSVGDTRSMKRVATATTELSGLMDGADGVSQADDGIAALVCLIIIFP